MNACALAMEVASRLAAGDKRTERTSFGRSSARQSKADETEMTTSSRGQRPDLSFFGTMIWSLLSY